MAEIIDIPLTDPTAAPIRLSLNRMGGSELAVLLPGLRYGCDRPLLAEAARVFAARDCDLARLHFAYADDRDFLAATDDRQFARIASDGLDILRFCAGLGRYDRSWIIGKSLGTLSMAAALSHGIRIGETRPVWLTPSLVGTPLLGQMQLITEPSLVVLGTRDPSNRPDLLGPLEAAAHFDTHLIEGADHGFDHPDGDEASRAAIAEVGRILARWVGQQAPPP